jgi:hypothetical protein
MKKEEFITDLYNRLVALYQAGLYVDYSLTVIIEQNSINTIIMTYDIVTGVIKLKVFTKQTFIQTIEYSIKTTSFNLIYLFLQDNINNSENIYNIKQITLKKL